MKTREEIIEMIEYFRKLRDESVALALLEEDLNKRKSFEIAIQVFSNNINILKWVLKCTD